MFYPAIVSLPVCLFVCLLATSRKSYYFMKIFFTRDVSVR